MLPRGRLIDFQYDDRIDRIDRIGRQLHANAPWRVDPNGLAIVAAGDGVALQQYQRATRQAKVVALPNRKRMA